MKIPGWNARKVFRVLVLVRFRSGEFLRGKAPRSMNSRQRSAGRIEDNTKTPRLQTSPLCHEHGTPISAPLRTRKRDSRKRIVPTRCSGWLGHEERYDDGLMGGRLHSMEPILTSFQQGLKVLVSFGNCHPSRRCFSCARSDKLRLIGLTASWSVTDKKNKNSTLSKEGLSTQQGH